MFLKSPGLQIISTCHRQHLLNSDKVESADKGNEVYSDIAIDIGSKLYPVLIEMKSSS